MIIGSIISLCRMPLIVLAAASIAILPACVGYQLGNTKHEKLKHIEKIYVPQVLDDTLEIKLAPQATNEIIRAISNDGTYRISRSEDSDATLKAKITSVDFDEFRSNRLDTLLAEELTITIFIEWQLIDNAGKVLEEGRSSGQARFFTDDNQRLSRDNAKPDALQRVARKITSRLSNGF